MPIRRFLPLALAWTLLAVAPAAESPAPPAPPATDPAAEPASPPFISDSEWERTRAAPATGPGAAPAPAGPALAAMGLALAVVLGLAAGSVFILRTLARRRGGPAAGRHLDVVETIHLGVKRSVSVLRLGDHLILIGQSEQGLSGLGTFPASALASLPPPAPAPAPPAPPVSGGPFAALLDSMLGKRR